MKLLTLACVTILLSALNPSPAISSVLSDPEGHEGVEVTLEGVSMGHNLEQTYLLMGYEQPISNRDFVLHDSTGMIYVSTVMKIIVNGEVRYKEYLVPDGREIRVTGVIELDDYGNPYLHANQRPVVL